MSEPAVPDSACRPGGPEAWDHVSREFARIEVAVQITSSSAHNFWTGFTRDIGEGGVFVVMSAPLQVGTVVQFEIGLPGAAELHTVVAVVRWVRSPNVASADLPSGMGLKFVELAPTLRSAIQRFADDQRDTLYYDDETD